MTQRLNYKSTSPDGYRAFGAIHQYIAKCGLAPTLVHLVYLRVSQINGCAYCVDLHANDALSAGVAPQKLNQLVVFEESNLFSDQERAALAWAESLTLLTTTHAPDHAYERVSSYFSAKEVEDLSYAIALMNAFNRLGVGFRVPPARSLPTAPSSDG
jgi:AhpD family alkylhydroperoxidase